MLCSKNINGSVTRAVAFIKGKIDNIGKSQLLSGTTDKLITSGETVNADTGISKSFNLTEDEFLTKKNLSVFSFH